ncbi:MAG: alcohol dehydrogenase catalytic domain-containing protein [bacterium]|nr:alcohol dehydrogenase catalytic domain-containing protein [Candidatus Sumerlaeota bacterium]
MLSAQVIRLNELQLVEKPVPEAGDDSLLIKVHSCAICGSDLRIYKRGDARANYPIVLGHEIAGTVAKVGRNVKGYAEGDRVCAAPGHGCGSCRYCLSGASNVCINPRPSIGYASDGGFAEYMVPPENVVQLGFVNRIPDSLTFDQASLSELLACCINAQENTPVREEDVVLIMGAGPAGCLQTDLSKIKGARKTLLTQRSVDRLELARRFNPDRCIASSQEDLKAAVMEETDGVGADVIFVCAPSVEAQQQAFQLVAPRGRINFFGGLPKDRCHITVNANELHYKEFFIGGASSSLARQNAEALNLLAEGKIDANKYITHKFPLSEIAQAFDMVESRKAIKVVVNP